MTCPVDRQPLTANQLKPASRILRNLLSRLNIKCDNASLGCTAVVKLDVLSNHCLECNFNPKKPIPCELGCGLVIPKDELKVSFLNFFYLILFLFFVLCMCLFN